MKPAEKKALYQKFLNKELDAAELDKFLQMIEKADPGKDASGIIPEVQETQYAVLKQKPSRNYKLFTRIAVAAALLLISGITYLTWQNNRQQAYLKQQSTFNTIQVPVGKMSIITLSDRSTITLTSGSVFKYPVAFSSNSRKVFLVKGKGFFEIAKDKNRPFTVYSAKLSTTALGTSFTVENYKEYQMEKIRLFTGKVSIGSKQKDFKPVYLTPGEQYNQTHKQGVKTTFKEGQVPQHIEDGMLTFENTSLREALIRVASYYNTAIDFEQANLNNFAINGQFKNEPLEDVLHTLLFTHHLKFKKTIKGYTIMN